jgi:hypothetical protein
MIRPQLSVFGKTTLILPEANNSQQPCAADSDILAAWEVAVARSSPGNAARPAR